MKLTKLQQVGLTGLLVWLSDEETLLETLDATGKEIAAEWMNLEPTQRFEMIGNMEQGLNNLKSAFNSIGNEFE